MKKNMIILVFVFASIIAACSTGQKAQKSSDLKPGVLLIMPSREVQDNELTITKSVLEEAGINVVVATIEGKEVGGMLGGSFKPDIKLANANENDFAMITIVGGNGAFDLFDNTELQNLVQMFNENGKFVTAICASAAILAKSGVLKDKDATCYPYQPIIDELTNNGANYLDQPVVISGKIITGNGPDASKAFANALVDAFKG
jgi:protease I